MKASLAALFVATLSLCPAVHAKDAVPASPSASAGVVSSRPTSSTESQLVEHTTYRNRYGVTVHSPAHTISGAAPAGASAQCRDGTYSFSQHRSGTCSHHGGVGSWL